MTQLLLVLVALSLQLATVGVRAASGGGTPSWPELVAAGVAAAIGFAAARARAPALLLLGVGVGASLLLCRVNTAEQPGLPRVLTVVAGHPLHLLPWVSTLLAVGGSGCAARALAALSPRGTAAGMGFVVLTIAVAAVTSVELEDLATTVMCAVPLGLTLLLHLRRAAHAAAVLALSAVAVALSPASVVAKLLARLAGTWLGDPYGGPSDQVPRTLWAILAGGLTGNPLVTATDLRRPFDDDLLALLSERHGLLGLSLVLAGCLAYAWLALRIAVRGPAWRPDERAACVAMVVGVALPIVWLAFAAIGCLPIMGICSALLYAGGSNLALLGALTGWLVGNRRAGPLGEGAFGSAALGAVVVVIAGTLAAASLAVGVVLAFGQPLVARLAVTCDGERGAVTANPRLRRAWSVVGPSWVTDRHGQPLGPQAAFQSLKGVLGAARSALGPGRVEVEGRCGRGLRGTDYSMVLPVYSGTPVAEFNAERVIVDSTFDMVLQQRVYDLLGSAVAENGWPGAMAVVLAGNGEPLAEVTRIAGDPAPGPNRAVDLGPRGAGVNLAGDLPLPPGSGVKPLLQLKALELGVPRDYTVHCHGDDAVLDGHGGKAQVHDTGHGVVGLQDGLGVSCNILASSLGMQVGAAGLHDLYASLGFTNSTVRTTAGSIAQSSFGQGEILVTPLALAHALTPFTAGVHRVCQPTHVRGTPVECVSTPMFNESDLGSASGVAGRPGTQSGVVPGRGGSPPEGERLRPHRAKLSRRRPRHRARPRVAASARPRQPLRRRL